MSKYKTGDKFIVEVEADPDTSEEDFYKLKGVCIVDSSILDKLEKYKEDDCDEDQSGQFSKGINFAQDTYRQLHDLSGFEINEIFKVEGGTAWAVIRKYTVRQIAEMIANYVPNIELGDRFCTIHKDGKTEEFLITAIDTEKEIYYYLFNDGKTGYVEGSDRLIKRINKRLPKKVDPKLIIDCAFD